MGVNGSALGRREFVAAAGATLLNPSLVRGSAAQGAVRLGLLGCGGRGVGVAESFVKNAGARITAVADLFSDRAEAARKQFQAGASQVFSGPHAAQALLASSEIDAAYIATPVFYHPEHLEAAVAAGKHVYVEKPVAVDVPGVKRALRAAEAAKGKVSVTVGLQLRHATPYVELARRIHAGGIGEIVSGLVHYYAGPIERPSWPKASPQERRLRNWMHDRTLSGDIVVEQNVHVLDFTNWILGGHPLSVWGAAGRKGRRDAGDCSSHYDCTFVYPNDIHVSFASTQFIEGAWDVAMRFFGTTGNAEAHYDAPVRITGKQPWTFPGLGAPGQVTDNKAAVTGVFHGALDDADAMKQRAFVESITSGRFLNEVAPGADSTMSAIMARMAADTGRVVRWEDVVESQEAWDPHIDGSAL
jgi:predicted dehydrogenase